MVLSFYAAILTWFFPAQQHTRQALQWWHQRQVERLHDGAEQIRDGLLQDLFAMRRRLELAQHNQEVVPGICLQQLEDFHRRLEQISNNLSPAYAQESLPHAIQYVLQTWRDRHPSIMLSSQIDPTHCPTAGNGDRVVIMTLEELLAILTAQLQADAQICVSLTAQEQTAQLTVEVKDGLDAHRLKALAQEETLSYLRCAFEVLTAGQCSGAVTHSGYIWCFQWRQQDP